MTISSLTTLAQLSCIISLIFQTGLILRYRRLPKEQKNQHFYFYLLSTFCFSLVMLLFGIMDYASPQLLHCSFLPTTVLFVFFESLSQMCLIGYTTSYFLRCSSCVLKLTTVLAAVVCATIKMFFTYKESPTMDKCHGTFVASREEVLAVVAIQLMCFIGMLVLSIVVYVYKFKDDSEGKMASGRNSVLGIAITGTVAILTTAVMGIAEYEANRPMLNYIQLAIVYSMENTLICVLAVVTCPIAWSPLVMKFPHARKQAKVGSAPRQQRYCSISLRSHRPPKQSKASIEIHIPSSKEDISPEIPNDTFQQLKV